MKNHIKIILCGILSAVFMQACNNTSSGPQSSDRGSLEVIIQTGGADQDRDGYKVTLDGGQSIDASINDTLLFKDLKQGSHQIELAGLNNECSVQDENPHVISVMASDTTHAVIEIQCEDVVLQNKIVYERGTALYMMNADGSDVQLITDTEMDQAPEISPDGKVIVTSGWDPESDEVDPNGEIYIIDASGYPVIPITNTIRPFNSSFPSWSPDGKRILFTQQGNQTLSWMDIIVINKDGSGKVNLTDSESNDAKASWSPDQLKIVFQSDRDGSTSDLFIMDSDGSNLRKLTHFGNTTEGQAAWSPDGTQIAFIRSYDIYLITPDGSEIQQLTDDNIPGSFNNHDSFPAWSPDSKQIVFSRRTNEQWDIFKINRDGTGLTNLTNTPNVHEYDSYWSPVQ